MAEFIYQQIIVFFSVQWIRLNKNKFMIYTADFHLIGFLKMAMKSFLEGNESEMLMQEKWKLCKYLF